MKDYGIRQLYVRASLCIASKALLIVHSVQRYAHRKRRKGVSKAVVVEKVIGRRSGDEDRGVYRLSMPSLVEQTSHTPFSIHLSFLDYLFLSIPE